MGRSKIICIFICCAAILFFSLQNFWNEKPDSSLAPTLETPPPDHHSRTRETIPPFTAIPSTGQPAVADSTQVNVGGISREYEAARDWRVLFESLLQRGTEGGGLYAVTILVRCSGMRETGAQFGHAAASRAQDNARQLYLSRCAGFAGDEGSLERAMQLLKDPRLKDDPYIALANAWKNDADDRQVHRQFLSRYFATQDPLLLERLGGRLFPDTGTGAGGTKFDGALYDEPHASAVFRQAWLAAVCEATNGGCGGTGDPYVNETCAVTDRCFGSRREAMEATVAEDFGPDQSRLFARIYPLLVNAIREKRSDAFF